MRDCSSSCDAERSYPKLAEEEQEEEADTAPPPLEGEAGVGEATRSGSERAARSIGGTVDAAAAAEEMEEGEEIEPDVAATAPGPGAGEEGATEAAAAAAAEGATQPPTGSTSEEAGSTDFSTASASSIDGLSPGSADHSLTILHPNPIQSNPIQSNMKTQQKSR